MTSKERAKLRSLANNDNPVCIIGKEGLTDEVITSVRQVLETRELIKFRVLNTCDLTAKECLEEICSKLNAEPVSCVGNVGVIYKFSSKKKTHVIAELFEDKQEKPKKNASTGHKPCVKAKQKRKREKEIDELKSKYIKSKIKENQAKKEGKYVKETSKDLGKKLAVLEAKGGKTRTKAKPSKTIAARKKSPSLAKGTKKSTRTGSSSVVSKVQKNLKNKR